MAKADLGQLQSRRDRRNGHGESHQRFTRSSAHRRPAGGRDIQLLPRIGIVPHDVQCQDDVIPWNFRGPWCLCEYI